MLLLTGLLHAPLGFAQIYGYVDTDGVSHFAAEALDARYRRLSGGKWPALVHSSDGESASANASRLQLHPGLLRHEALLRRMADEFKLDPALLKAVAAAESGFDAQAVSPKGAIGLMQVMPDTAERFGLAPRGDASIAQRLMDPETNVRLSARYLTELTAMFPRKPALVLAAYNAGEGAVRRYGNRVPPYADTQRYVALVSQLYGVFGGPALQPVLAPRGDAPARIRLTIPGAGRRDQPLRPVGEAAGRLEDDCRWAGAGGCRRHGSVAAHGAGL